MATKSSVDQLATAKLWTGEH